MQVDMFSVHMIFPCSFTFEWFKTIFESANVNSRVFLFALTSNVIIAHILGLFIFILITIFTLENDIIIVLFWFLLLFLVLAENVVAQSTILPEDLLANLAFILLFYM